LGIRDVRENITVTGNDTQGHGTQNGANQAANTAARSGMKFIKQGDSVKEITSITLSPNKRFMAVCERQKGEPNTFIVLYDVKLLFKQLHGTKEKLRLNVGDLYAPLTVPQV
jgi:hypothetical protein